MSINKTEFQKLHPSFQLNGKLHTEESLLVFAKALIDEQNEEEQAIGFFLKQWFDDKSYIEVSTSGSTGKPKEIKVAKLHMVNSAKATACFFKAEEHTTALLCLSASYIAGKMMLVRAMVLGWNLDTVLPSAIPLKGITKKYDFCAMVPMQLNNSLQQIELIKKLIVGGAAIPYKLCQAIQFKKTKIYETYGMTETVSHIAIKRVNSKKRSFEKAFFKTLANVTVSMDSKKCLVVDAPLVSSEILKTNDIVKLLSPKKFFWKGRLDNVINSGGVKLFPEQIERKLQVLFKDRFIISWLPDAVLGQRLVLLLENSNSELSEKEVLTKLKVLNNLKKYEIPKQVFCLNSFAETPTGKVHREKNRMRVMSKCS